MLHFRLLMITSSHIFRSIVKLCFYSLRKLFRFEIWQFISNRPLVLKRLTWYKFTFKIYRTFSILRLSRFSTRKDKLFFIFLSKFKLLLKLCLILRPVSDHSRLMARSFLHFIVKTFHNIFWLRSKRNIMSLSL